MLLNGLLSFLLGEIFEGELVETRNTTTILFVLLDEELSNYLRLFILIIDDVHHVTHGVDRIASYLLLLSFLLVGGG